MDYWNGILEYPTHCRAHIKYAGTLGEPGDEAWKVTGVKSRTIHPDCALIFLRSNANLGYMKKEATGDWPYVILHSTES